MDLVASSARLDLDQIGRLASLLGTQPSKLAIFQEDWRASPLLQFHFRNLRVEAVFLPRFTRLTGLLDP